LDVVGLETGKKSNIRAAVRESAQTQTLTGNGDSIQKIEFRFPGIPGSIHGVSVEMSSPNDSTGGRFSYAWSAGYECGVICQAPAQRFFIPLDMSSGRLFWQRIPTGARQYEWSMFAEADSTNQRSGTVLAIKEIYPGVDIDSLVPGTTYHFRVRNDCNTGGWSDWSGYTTFVFPHTREALNSDPASNREWSVYPNPATDRVMLQTGIKQNATLGWQWINLEGQVCAQGTGSVYDGASMSILLPGGPAGIYLLRVQNGTETQVFKVLKIEP
jgi:hypothetical protein